MRSKLVRYLAAFLALMLMLPCGVFADEEGFIEESAAAVEIVEAAPDRDVAEVVAEVVEAALDEIEVEVADVEADGDAAPAEAVEETAGESPEVEEIEAEIEEAPVEAAPDFVRGYARAEDGAPVYASANADAPVGTLPGGVVYMLDEDGGRIRVAFALDGVEAEYYVPAGALHETGGADFDASGCCYDDDPSLPLCEIELIAAAKVEDKEETVAEEPAEEESALILRSLLGEEEGGAVSFSLGVKSVSIGVGESYAPELVFSDGAAHPAKFKSANGRVAVTADGLLRGKSTGKCSVTVTTEFGKKTLTVNVKKAPSKVAASPASMNVGAGQSFTVKASLPSGAAGAVSFESLDPGVLEIESAGRSSAQVKALSEGEGRVQLTTYNGHTAVCSVGVTRAPEAADMTLEAPDVMGAGEKAKAGASLGACCGSFTFSTDRTELLKVDAASGALEALGCGDAELTVTAYNGASVSKIIHIGAAPAGIELAEPAVVLGVGETYVIPAPALTGEDAVCTSFSYKSAKTSCAAVSAEGVVKGKKTGSTTVTVKSYNGATAKLKVTVKKAPSKVKLDSTSKTLGVGESFTVKAVLPSGSAGEVCFESSNADALVIESVDGLTCTVRAVGVGEAELTATAYNGKAAACAVTVKKAPGDGDMTILAPDALGVGEKGQASLELGGAAGSYTFSTSPANVLSVDAAGALTALKRGDAVLTATAYNGVSATKSIHVGAAPAGIEFEIAALTLSKGDTYTLPAPIVLGSDAFCSSYTYKSSNKSYATVSAAGVVTAKKKGSAVITVTSYNGETAKLKLTVKDAPGSIAFADKSLTLYIGMSCEPAVSFSNKVAASYALTSSDPSVVCVCEDGRTIEALGAGSCVITAKSYNGKKAVLSVRVPKLPSEIRLAPDSVTLGVGDSQMLTPVLGEGEESNYVFTVEGGAVSVSADGLVSALEAGSAVVSAETFNGLTASADITVVPAPTAVQLDKHLIRRCLSEVGDKLTVSFGAEGEGGRYAFKSSDESIAAVDADGTVRFVAPGSCVITVTTYNGLTDSCSVEVGTIPTSMAFAQDSYQIALGDTISFMPDFEGGFESFTLSSDNTCIVTGDMAITAVSSGSATVTAVSVSGCTDSCTVEVVPAPTGVELDRHEFELVRGVNGTDRLTATVSGGVGSYTFASSDPAIVRAEDDGTLTVTGFGAATVTVTTYNGLTDSCAVTTRGLLEGTIIGIDPGHQRHGDSHTESSKPNGGSSKPRVSDGTSGRKTHIAEYRTVLQIGLKLREVLQYYGAEVVMTRETHDVNISNKERAKMMNEAGVDLWLRLHTNGVSDTSCRGTVIFTRESILYTEAQLPNKAEVLAHETKLAKIMINAMCAETGFKKFGGSGLKRNNDYTGNNWSKSPCLLVEMGFSSNGDEDVKLNDATVQWKFAQGMANGIATYFEQVFPERGITSIAEKYPVE